MNRGKSSARRRHVMIILVWLIVSISAPGPLFRAWSAEFGTGLYVLGYQSSLAGFQPEPGLYLRNDFYIYGGTARILPFSRRVEVDLRSRFITDLVSAAYVTPLKILGGNYALGIIWSSVASNFLRGRLQVGGVVDVSREGEYTGVGDLVVTPVSLGWHLGQVHIMAFGNFYAPVGSYNAARRLNTGLNRWALEPNVAVTWLPQYGQEVSISMGYTVNFENKATDYTTGNEFHLEFFLGQHLAKGFALGLAGYLYQQVTADHGPGARLGAFHGQTIAVGPCLTFNSKIAGHPFGLNVRYYNELKVKNRFDGQALFGTVSLGF
ncbi:MAG: hypothetical protein FJ134_06870 [Deltaproteobacteria bacterium]|nr:hypothetical protein [Deltaproteobacteria bacterium]